MAGLPLSPQKPTPALERILHPLCRAQSLASSRFPVIKFCLNRSIEGEFSLETTGDDFDRPMLRVFQIDFTDTVNDFF